MTATRIAETHILSTTSSLIPRLSAESCRPSCT